MMGVVCFVGDKSFFSVAHLLFFVLFFFLLMRGNALNFAKQNGNANNNNFSRIQCVKSVLKASKSSSVATPQHRKRHIGAGKILGFKNE